MIARFFQFALLLALLVVATPCASAAQSDAVRPANDNSDRHIAELIHQLGDEQYSVRQQAQEKLAKFGAEAFDALVAAQDDDDLEIADRARFLVNLIRIDWIHDSDSPEIKQKLQDYDTLTDDGRLERMAQLAEMPRDSGIEALCRLIRFERSHLISKEGAMLILEQPEPVESVWPVRAKAIVTCLAGSNRAAAKWLRAYVQFHTDPEAALGVWDKLVADENATVEPDNAQEETQLQSDLMRREVEMLLKRKHQDRAVAMMRKMIDRETDDVDSLIEFVEWLVKNHAWSVVDDVAKRFDRTFVANARLLYTLAQARQVQGSDALAEKFASQAYELNMAPHPDLTNRFKIASWLELQGLMPWCEREYRFILAHAPAESDEAVSTRLALSELLHDQEREGDAAGALQPLVDLLRRNGALNQRLTNAGHPPKSIRSRLHYFLACQFALKNDLVHQAEELDTAIGYDASDADVLIALFRLPNQDAAHREKTNELIRDALDQFRSELTDDTDSANAYNQYAWLAANTGNDLDRALEFAEKAVELEPDSGGIVDTLAHCYAAKKDFVNAVKSETQAIELEPHSMQIQKALERFRKALAEAKK